LTPSRIAVIGIGVAGLTAAHLLSRQHKVTLIEKNDYLGGHTNTIEVPDGPDAGTPIDTGFIVYNDKNYPTFIRLLDTLGVQTRASDMSFSFSSLKESVAYSSSVPNGLFANRFSLVRPSHYQMICDIITFNQRATTDLEHGELEGETLGSYLKPLNLSKAFLSHYLIPMGAAIWSTPPNQMLNFPVETFVRFFFNHGLLAFSGRPNWRTVVGGGKSYVRAFLSQFKGEVKTRTHVKAVLRGYNEVTISFQGSASEQFDYVVLGTHANEAVGLLSDATEDEKRLLGAWTYTKNHAVLHTDESVMPWVKRAWASWNYNLEGLSGEERAVSVTYHMNRLQALNTKQQYFVTLNRKIPVVSDAIIREIDYTHPSYTFESAATQADLPKLNGKNRTFFCGSYFGYGFHEDAVKSGLRVAEYFGISL
jgi:uncharacterized protein